MLNKWEVEWAFSPSVKWLFFPWDKISKNSSFSKDMWVLFALPIFTYKSDKSENLSNFISESMTVRLKSKRMDLEGDQSCVFS